MARILLTPPDVLPSDETRPLGDHACQGHLPPSCHLAKATSPLTPSRDPCPTPLATVCRRPPSSSPVITSSANILSGRPPLKLPSPTHLSSRKTLPLSNSASSATPVRRGDSPDLDGPPMNTPFRMAVDERERWVREEEEESRFHCHLRDSEDRGENDKENVMGDGTSSRSRPLRDIGILKSGTMPSESSKITARGLPVRPLHAGQEAVSTQTPIPLWSVTPTSDKAPERTRAVHLGCPSANTNHWATTIPRMPTAELKLAWSRYQEDDSSTDGSITTPSTSTVCEDETEDQVPAILQTRVRQLTRKVRLLEEEKERLERLHNMALEHADSLAAAIDPDSVSRVLWSLCGLHVIDCCNACSCERQSRGRIELEAELATLALTVHNGVPRAIGAPLRDDEGVRMWTRVVYATLASFDRSRKLPLCTTRREVHRFFETMPWEYFAPPAEWWLFVHTGDPCLLHKVRSVLQDALGVCPNTQRGMVLELLLGGIGERSLRTRMMDPDMYLLWSHRQILRFRLAARGIYRVFLPGDLELPSKEDVIEVWVRSQRGAKF